MKIIPVILAGGAGTRLWPLSREDKPKQFHNLSGDGTLLEETIKRLFPLNPENYVIVTSLQYESASLQELDKCGVEGVILAEPYPRNTAAAVLYAATYLEKTGDDSIMIMLPADHYIGDPEGFLDILRTAVDHAQSDKLVSIGITPTYPETGYGYIQSVESDGKVRNVEQFVEKPDLARAQQYLDEGNFFWNSGIFVWKTSQILKNFKKLMPDLYMAFEPMRSMEHDVIRSNDDTTWNIKKTIFEELKKESIDFGIMEKAENRLVIPGDFGWADLGSWYSIDGILPANGNNNRTPEKDKVIFLDSSDCSAFPEGKRITLIGLSNIVVIESGNDILVMDKNSSQKVRRVVEIVKERDSLK
ncbi:MAG TPA: mannose-1-phosphate guanylyltransferase [Spirochaetota bacterium]|nr:mannose-1-phosphate guanylyltransferase [Spirochaetota bacterium]HPJ37487.1 mannose-1-phosphate guanylyltransferase [Spirochaetota bacterium]HPQ51852.1 mannose-1-phosphate guanylyltransferase [Spirochaetota bacterium]